MNIDIIKFKQHYHKNIFDWTWHDLCSKVIARLKKHQPSSFGIDSVSLDGVPEPIFKRGVLRHHGKFFGRKRLYMGSTNTMWTSKFDEGSFPYKFSCCLMNNGKRLMIKDKHGVYKDVYISHMTYMKKSGNILYEFSIMHMNPSSIWQVTTKSNWKRNSINTNNNTI